MSDHSDSASPCVAHYIVSWYTECGPGATLRFFRIYEAMAAVQRSAPMP